MSAKRMLLTILAAGTVLLAVGIGPRFTEAPALCRQPGLARRPRPA